jgi:tRNA A-37 threonylcarbamoyl transferase component Bud32
MAVSYPRQFGKYVLLKPLAKGGMGEIYLAALGQIDGFDKLCVIKKVIPEKSDEGKAKRFLDEAKVVLRLAHSGLVNTFDAGQVEREFYIAMEMVEGKDLREVWNRCVRVRHRIPIEVALHVAREVARALSYVHTYGELNLVHRDVAPPNIMLAYNGDVKLTDFGLARSALKQEHTQPGVVFGRAAYLAPEQARGEVADPGTDVYSLAVVLWELLTGHQYLQISGAPWVTPALAQVLMRALATDRDKRFTSAEEFRLALSDAIAEAAPRTDAGRVSELMHAIYEKAIAEEAAERERFLKEVLPSFRAASTPAPVRTPPPVPLSRRGDGRVDDGGSRRSSARMPKMAAPSTPGVQASQNDREARTRAKREAAQKVLAELAAGASENEPAASRK